MKILKYITLFLFPCLSSCLNEEFEPETWAIDPKLDLSESGLVFNATNNTDTIRVNTNYNDFTATCEDAWCMIKPIVNDSLIVVSVSPNMSAEQRKTTINVAVGRGTKVLSKPISIVQMGGYWDVIDEFSVYWSSNVTETQKETISEILSSMVFVKGGRFVMGEEPQYSTAADTRHEVQLSDFYINKTEVTQKQWNVINGSNNSTFKGENLPVENVTWEECYDFVLKLARLTNLKFNIPTEAQWEYAARGGVYSMGYIYPGSNDYTEVMTYKGYENLSDPTFTTYNVGEHKPNELGIYDMAGNVSEWCFDWYDDYVLSPQVNPVGPAIGERHVIRGGDLTNFHFFCTVSHRASSGSAGYTGLRLCISL